MDQPAILTINPGTTTTRLGLFRAKGATVTAIHEETIEHDEAVMTRSGWTGSCQRMSG